MSLRERTRPGLGIFEPCLPSPAERPPSGPGCLHDVIPGDGDPCPRCGVPMHMTERVVNSNQEQLTMGGCLGLLGFESAKEFLGPLYHSWKFKGWACQFGNREIREPDGFGDRQRRQRFFCK
jgi:hypothetical protein